MSDPLLVAIVTVVVGGMLSAAGAIALRAIDTKANRASDDIARAVTAAETGIRTLEGMERLVNAQRAELDRTRSVIDELEKDLAEERAIVRALSAITERHQAGETE